MELRAPTRQLLAALTVMALLLAAVAVPAAAAGRTDVRLVADTDEVPVDGTTTVAVVVMDAEGGVGAYNLTVSLEADHARITNASAAGGAGFQRNDIADDGSSVRMVAALLNTTDTGSVTIATVTIEGTAEGRSDLSLAVPELGDEEGRAYTVADTTGVSVDVTGPSTAEPSGGGDGGGDAPRQGTATDTDGGPDTDEGSPNDATRSTETATPAVTGSPSSAAETGTTADVASSEAGTEATPTPSETRADDRPPEPASGPIERIQRSIPMPVVGGIVLAAIVLGVFVVRRR
jgi:hypothetical protein